MKFIFKRYAEIKVQFSFNQANHKTNIGLQSTNQPSTLNN